MSWQSCRLGDVLTLKRGHDLPEQQRQDGEVPVVSSSGITGWHKESKAKAPGVVTGRYGTIGEVFFLEQDYWPLNTALYSVNLHGNHAGFLRYMLEPLAPLFHLNSAKSAVPGIDRSDIHTIPVAVPLGVPKFVLLKALKNSARNSAFETSLMNGNAKFFCKPKSS